MSQVPDTVLRMGDGGAQLGATLLVGAAGTGKTTQLEERAVQLLREGGTVVLLARNQAAARRSRVRVAQAVGATDRFLSTTMHAFALGILKRGWPLAGYHEEPPLVSAPEQVARVRELLDTPEEQERWEVFPRAKRLAGFAVELREFIVRAQDADESPRQLAERAAFTNTPHLVEAAAFYGRYLEAARAAGEVDHGTAIREAARLLEPDLQEDPHGSRAAFATAIRAANEHLLIDDLHTVTPAMLRLIAAAANPDGSVTASIDPEAPSFGFRGSADAIDALFEKRFWPVDRVALTTRHRPQPRVSSHRFAHPADERAAIVHEIRRAHGDLKLAYADIAIIVRSLGPEVDALRRALHRARIPVSVVGENRALGAEPALLPVLDLVRCATDPEGCSDVLPRVLASPTVSFDSFALFELQHAARREGTDLAGLLRRCPESLAAVYRDRLLELRGLLDDLRTQIETARRADDVWWWLWTGACKPDSETPRFRYLLDLVRTGDPVALDAVDAFAMSVTRSSDRRPSLRFDQLVDAMRTASFGAEPWNTPEERRPDSVRILTAFAALGREFDLVLVPGCVDGTFPLRRERRALIDLRDLIAPADALERRRRHAEHEERVFASVLDRARQAVVLTVADDGGDVSAEASPLARERGFHFDEPIPAPPATAFTRDEFEALQRRRLTDPTSNDAVRAEALGILARLRGVDPETWWYEQDWTRTDPMIHDEPFRTSYSKLESYENCPLQYLYASEAGLDQGGSPATAVGTWVHAVLERATNGILTGNETPTIGSMTEWLEELWDETVFDNAAVEHRRRRESVDIFRRWLERDAHQPVHAVEVGFKFQEGNATIRGFIDRIAKRNDGGSELIDYKTGTSYPSQDEVEQSLQLAIYHLAIERDPALHAYGPVNRASLRYLAVERWRTGYYQPHFLPPADFGETATQRLRGIIQGIEIGRFEPSGEASCRWCRFKTLCPIEPQGAEVVL